MCPSPHSQNTQQPPQSSISKRHHRAITVVSPARQSAAARHSTGVILHNRTSQAPSYPLDKQHMHFTQYQNRQPHQQPNQSSSHRPLSHEQQQRSTSQTILLCPTPPSQRRCSTQQPPRACFDMYVSRRQAAHNKHRVSRSMVPPPLSKHATAPSKQLLQKASPGHEHCIPSMTQRRCSTPHRSAPAKSHVTSPIISA